jgi:hypothetical protein
MLLADGVHVTTEIVANYYEVDVETIKKLVQRHRAEMSANGYNVFKGDDLRELKRDNPSLLDAKSLAVFTKRTMLNIGQLLTGSPIAKAVRTALLDTEEKARSTEAVEPVAIAAQSEIDRAHIARAQIEMLGVAVSTGLLDKLWATSKTHVIAARTIGEEPEQPPELKPLYVPDFLKTKGVTKKKDVTSVMSWFGRRVSDLCTADGVEVPEKRPRELPDGTIRDTIAWRVEHLPYFERVWNIYYAEQYAQPMFLELGAA